MFPITSFTASPGHDGNIDIFALALSPQAQPGHGVSVFRIRQRRPVATGGPGPLRANPATGLSGCAASPTFDGHVLADGGAGHLWFNERKPDDTFSLRAGGQAEPDEQVGLAGAGVAKQQSRFPLSR